MAIERHTFLTAEAAAAFLDGFLLALLELDGPIDPDAADAWLCPSDPCVVIVNEPLLEAPVRVFWIAEDRPLFAPWDLSQN